jgi:cell division protein ZapA (FtsZ GTPase activity inhibitor)
MNGGDDRRPWIVVAVLGAVLIMAALTLAECLFRIDNLNRQVAALRSLLALEEGARQERGRVEARERLERLMRCPCP